MGNKMKVLAILLTVVAVALAQDTHFCPDNWELHKPEGRDTCSCFYFAGRDVRVNHADATTLCQIRGGWLAQVEDAPEENYWVVGKLLEKMTEEGKLVEGELDVHTGKINGGLEQNHTLSTMTIIPENGSGKQPTQLLNGLIGLKESQTIITDNNACHT